MKEIKKIRNFAIIAHIDHGKSTLADRLLELTGVVEVGKHEEQLLDRSPISRERGITIKLAPVRMEYEKWKFFPNPHPNPSSYILNLIDTPGHVDFSYEVDRTLSCVEGVILLVDATQGVQAQTISNAVKAVEKNLVIIPAVNKIDLPNADVESTKKQIVDFLSPFAKASEGQGSLEVFEVSAKTGENVEKLLQAVMEKIPSPLSHPHPNPSSYILNLIDTPGHVDFSYEVDRTLSCVEGVILLVDATQGVQAQTISNAVKAVEKNLVIIPAVNKIDLPNADVESTKKQIVDFLSPFAKASEGQGSLEVFEVSAKTGENVEKLLQAVVEKIPSPLSHPQGVQALIFDSYYDQHRGVIAFVRVFSGNFKKGVSVRLASSQTEFEILDLGYFSPDLQSTASLQSGEIGYIATNLKDIHKVRVGDTIVDEKGISATLSGYRRIKPMVFASIFPTDTNEFLSLKKALEKLYLTDSSLEYSTTHSKALGTGFRVGFLGLLHADVVRERLEREFDLDLILTPPKVEFKSEKGVSFYDRGKDTPSKFLEPFVKMIIITPQKYLGSVMQLCQTHRAKFITMDNKSQMMLSYEIPMSELISDFFDKLKSVSSGYASLDWEFLEYRDIDADKLTLLLNGESVEEFSEIVVKERAFEKARNLVRRLRELIPRQQYEVKIQAQFKGKIIASERIAPYRKDVTKKLYGGDRTRKDKLLDKQKEGKKKMKMIGRVEIPKEAFLKLFKKS